MLMRRKVFAILVLPLAAFLWFIGWGLSWVGFKKTLISQHAKTTSQKTLDLIVMMPESLKHEA
jgi:hypothetical protein